ncbi:hypothetical protein [Pseudomonas aeruginosa]|uniref:hypothetical protein n=1 Tax=Pseudomonas aeruginosa TaxID=287 RepID=UPI00300C70E6
MSIDWSKAPSSATHYLPEQKDLGWGACWYKKDGDKWLVMNCARLEKRDHMEWFVDDSEVDKFVPLLVPRSAFPSEWNGQGLPPVGTVCEYYADENTWRRCEIVAHKDGQAVVWVNNAHIWASSGASLRPISTPEQIAAQEREKAIKEMCFAEETLTVKQAKALYDAGYRRQEEGK